MVFSVAEFVICFKSLSSEQLSLGWKETRELRSQGPIEETCPKGILFPLNARGLNLKNNFKLYEN